MDDPQDLPAAWPQAVLFDLLTALLDSWSVWNAAAGSEAAGRAWRAEYLRLTYGCGRYEPYESLVRRAAQATGLPEAAAARLEAQWRELPPWSGAREVLAAIAPHCKLAVVTNCSERLGHQAADLLGVRWDAVVTAEAAGCYKPDPRPYELALRQLGVAPRDAAFVAGSGYDMFGTARVGLALPHGAPAPEITSPTLDALPQWLRRFGSHAQETR